MTTTDSLGDPPWRCCISRALSTARRTAAAGASNHLIVADVVFLEIQVSVVHHFLATTHPVRARRSSDTCALLTPRALSSNRHSCLLAAPIISTRGTAQARTTTSWLAVGDVVILEVQVSVVHHLVRAPRKSYRGESSRDLTLWTLPWCSRTWRSPRGPVTSVLRCSCTGKDPRDPRNFQALLWSTRRSGAHLHQLFCHAQPRPTLRRSDITSALINRLRVLLRERERVRFLTEKLRQVRSSIITMSHHTFTRSLIN